MTDVTKVLTAGFVLATVLVALAMSAETERSSLFIDGDLPAPSSLSR